MILIMSNDIINTLRSSGGRDRLIGPGEYLFHLGEAVAALYVVLEGEIHLIRHQKDGSAIVFQRAGPGAILAEASLFSDRYHCDAVARTRATVRNIPKRRVLNRLRSDADFAEAWVAHLAHAIQSLRFRSEVLSLRTVAFRLDAWLAWHIEIPPKGKWKQLANEIGVSAEALYREMARRRE